MPTQFTRLVYSIIASGLLRYIISQPKLNLRYYYAFLKYIKTNINLALR